MTIDNGSILFCIAIVEPIIYYIFLGKSALLPECGSKPATLSNNNDRGLVNCNQI